MTCRLGVLSGKVKSGDKESICSDMFPNGAPANAASDPSWQACKGVVTVGSLLSEKRVLRKTPLTAAEKEAVGAALSNALGVMSGKVKSEDKFTICSNMFPNGAPTDAADASWQACKDSLPSTSQFSSLLSWKDAVHAKGGAQHPLTAAEQEAVGAALSNALGVLSGKVQSGSKFDICSDLTCIYE